uniref:Uncharacterized protein n=1 Tax=Nelumbo nucifera TaxID=4432 RepID=A0A822Z4T5_NELNU|nr:TPA_asm: hypothetical protein HUJ06_015677 [Nelumbo nucifera]
MIYGQSFNRQLTRQFAYVIVLMYTKCVAAMAIALLWFTLLSSDRMDSKNLRLVEQTRWNNTYRLLGPETSEQFKKLHGSWKLEPPQVHNIHKGRLCLARQTCHLQKNTPNTINGDQHCQLLSSLTEEHIN